MSMLEDALAFFNACKTGDLAAVKKTAAAGTKANWATGFVQAAHHGHLAVVEFIYTCGASHYGNLDDAVLAAWTNDHIAVMKFLFEHGATDYTCISREQIAPFIALGMQSWLLTHKHEFPRAVRNEIERCVAASA
jgi:hypothetical protein